MRPRSTRETPLSAADHAAAGVDAFVNELDLAEFAGRASDEFLLNQPQKRQSLTDKTMIGSAIFSGAISCARGSTAVPIAKNSIT